MRSPSVSSSHESSDQQAPAPSSKAQSRAVRGGAFTLGAQLVIQGLRLVQSFILTRLLPPEAHGLMALVHAFRGAIALCTDVGISPSIVRDPRGAEPAFLNTAWTVQAGRGLLLFVLALAGTLPMALFYDEPRLQQLIPVTALSALITGVQTTKFATADRNLEFGRSMSIEIAAQLAALAVMITWALISPSVWALVAGALVGALVDVVLGHLFLRGHNPRFGWDKEAAQSLLRFGRWVFISTLLTFAATQSDRLVFGKMTELTTLGVYHVAAVIGGVPIGAMGSLAQKVMFPLFSQADRRGEGFAKVFHDARRVYLSLSGWVLSGLIGGGPAAVSLLYDERYEAGGWMLRWIALGGWLATPEAVNSAVALARGEPRWLAAGNLAKLIAMAVLLPLGLQWGGFEGVLIAYAATGLPRYLVSCLAVRSAGLSTWAQDFRFTSWVIIAAAASGAALEVLRPLGVPAALECAVVFVVVTALWSPILWPYVAPRLRPLFGGASG